MPRFCGCCNGDEDGILYGEERPLPNSMYITLTDYFRNEVKAKRIKLSKPAVVFSLSTYTFAELDHYSTGVALEIQKHLGNAFSVANPDEEILIAVCLPFSERLIPLIFAVLKLGAAFLPLDPQYPEDLLLTIINKFRPTMVITDDDGPILGKYDAKQFADYSKLMSIEEIWLDMEVPPDDEAPHDPAVPSTTRLKPWRKEEEQKDEIEMFSTPLPCLAHERPCLVLHTTGVSGNPQGVRICHLSILNRLMWEWRTLPYGKKCVAALTSPINSLDAFVQIFSALLRGVTLHVFRKTELLSMANFIHKISDQQITRLSLSPQMVANFLKACEGLGRQSPEFEHIKHVCCIGGPLPFELAQYFTNFFMKATQLVNFYGSPETGDVFYSRIESDKDLERKSLMDVVCFDKVMDNCIVYVLSNYLELIKDGTQGEICVSGDCVALGYVDMKEEEGENRFVDNPHDDRKAYRRLFRTGEYGRLGVKNGRRFIYIEGRIDSQVKVKGYDIIMEELRDLLMQYENEIEEAHMLPYHAGQLDQTVVGFVLPRQNVRTTLMAEEVRGKLLSRIPEYLAPDIKIIEDVPKVGQRVSAHKLLKMYQEDRKSTFSNWGKVRLPNDKLACCKLLMDALFKFGNIPMELVVEKLDKSFYELGGNSLTTISVVVYINKNNCPINVREFVMAKSLNEIIELMVGRMGKPRDLLENLGLSAIAADVEVKEDFAIEIISSALPCKKEAASLLSHAYVVKDILARYNLMQFDDFYEFLMTVWQIYVEQQISTIVTRKKDNKIVACCLCHDFYTPTPEFAKGKTLFHLLEYQQELKGTILSSVPHLKNSIFEIVWLGTHSSLTAKENVIVTQMIMNENIRLAKLDGFTSLFISATSPLLRDLCLDVLNFTMLDDYPPKTYQESPDFHPFRAVPSSITTALCWLVVGDIPSKTPSIDPSIISSLLDKSDSIGQGSKEDQRKGKKDSIDQL